MCILVTMLTNTNYGFFVFFLDVMVSKVLMAVLHVNIKIRNKMVVK